MNRKKIAELIWGKTEKPDEREMLIEYKISMTLKRVLKMMLLLGAVYYAKRLDNNFAEVWPFIIFVLTITITIITAKVYYNKKI